MARKRHEKRKGGPICLGGRDGMCVLAAANCRHEGYPRMRMFTGAGACKAANDCDPFAGEFEKLAGTEKRDPYGQPFAMSQADGCKRTAGFREHRSPACGGISRGVGRRSTEGEPPVPLNTIDDLFHANQRPKDR